MNRTIRRECAFLTFLALVVIGVMYGVPLARVAFGSLFSYQDFGASRKFVDLANYVSYFRDPSFSQSFFASLAFTIPSVILQVGFAFVAALLTRRRLPGFGALRWMLMAPYFLSTVVVVVAWRFFSDPFVGPLPAMLSWVGIASPDLRGPTAALPVMIIVATYEAFPFTYVVLLARLVQIPASLYEVTELAGANPWRTFAAVTWPQVSLTVGGLILLRILITWLKFDVPWLVYAAHARSQWGDTLAVFIYRTAFENLQTGKAYAASLSLVSAAWAVYGLYVLTSRQWQQKGVKFWSNGQRKT
jgi:ABC-type sugar transport system permease subunit